MSALTQSPEWKSLESHYTAVSKQHMREMFNADPQRFEKFALRFEDILLDYSKNRITAETMDLLRQLAVAAGLKEWTNKMFAGEKINFTEDRAVLHIALRNRSDRPILVNGNDVMPQV